MLLVSRRLAARTGVAALDVLEDGRESTCPIKFFVVKESRVCFCTSLFSCRSPVRLRGTWRELVSILSSVRPEAGNGPTKSSNFKAPPPGRADAGDLPSARKSGWIAAQTLLQSKARAARSAVELEPGGGEGPRRRDRDPGARRLGAPCPHRTIVQASGPSEPVTVVCRLLES